MRRQALSLLVENNPGAVSYTHLDVYKRQALDPVHGLQINGETFKLRGTCIHHDNGVIGAETFKEAECCLLYTSARIC